MPPDNVYGTYTLLALRTGTSFQMTFDALSVGTSKTNPNKTINKVHPGRLRSRKGLKTAGVIQLFQTEANQQPMSNCH